ncbi:hypothetical protein COY62_03695 [bacterium (Candidatus Howlettbacteria) CG_4_10_14_0_8_um_filter_40_9]|nr:MAG: hypothetical protein COY62_03695 [bacterium (Candidatus Howlettbacteria) CG_4_10_14_0_8_um_filter_40_9]
MKDQTLKFISYFITIATFIYVFVGITGVNLPAYYPVLHKWSISPIKDAVSMGFYGRVAFTLIVSLIATFILTAFTKTKDTNESLLAGFTKASVIFGIFFFIGEEWHKWGIEKMKFDSKPFLNYEFWFFAVLVTIFVSIVCFTTGNCRKKK